MLLFNVLSILVFLKESEIMKNYVIRMRNELFERVKILAKEYGLSINKMLIKLIEKGYLKMLGDD